MVFIVLFNWNGIADTLGCLASLKKLDYASRQTVVVDNGSDDGSPARLKAEYPDVLLLEHRTNLGFTGGANAGIRYALDRGADYIWLLNNDTLVEPHSLSALLAAANSDEAITLVSPFIYNYPDTRSLQFRGVFADLAGQGLIPAITLETPPGCPGREDRSCCGERRCSCGRRQSAVSAISTSDTSRIMKTSTTP